MSACVYVCMHACACLCDFPSSLSSSSPLPTLSLPIVNSLLTWESSPLHLYAPQRHECSKEYAGNTESPGQDHQPLADTSRPRRCPWKEVVHLRCAAHLHVERAPGRQDRLFWPMRGGACSGRRLPRPMPQGPCGGTHPGSACFCLPPLTNISQETHQN